ncbi:MAG: hypothetical protein FWG87_13055 [Defluviitaleaceae bacterium]|nr:hypothetical protein [Defluviitaleaceae bacterium]
MNYHARTSDISKIYSEWNADLHGFNGFSRILSWENLHFVSAMPRSLCASV